jgi:hypothetical protein
MKPEIIATKADIEEFKSQIQEDLKVFTSMLEETTKQNAQDEINKALET